MVHYNRSQNIEEALPGLDEPNKANVIWVDQHPTASEIDENYIYMWVDPDTSNLMVSSLDDSGNLLELTLNVTTDDTGLIGGLL